MSQPDVTSDAREHRSRALSGLGGVAAIVVAVMLLSGFVGLVVSTPGLVLRNWLVVLFQINAEVGDLPAEPMRVLNPLDIAVLVVVGLTFLGLWPGPDKAHRIWMGVAIALPFVGIAVLLVTGIAGRSSVMGAGLVVALLMLTSRPFRPLAFLGILANALLLAGDFATGSSRAPVVAALVVAGYALLIAWFLFIAARLLVWTGSGRSTQTGGQT